MIYLADLHGTPIYAVTFDSYDDAFDYALDKGLDPGFDVLICGTDA